MKFSLPYDKGVMAAEIADANVMAVLESKAASYRAAKTQEELVEESLDNPIGSPKLEDLVKGKKSITIISSDHTRPVPSHITMPILLRRIRSVEPDADIRILVATGFHRPSTHEELVAKYGEEIVEHEQIVMHVSTDDASMVKIGTLPSGGACIVNRTAVEADLLIAEGFIESHFFAGFSGGRKAVLPGISSYKTIMANHCGEFINSHNARTGNLLDNPVHRDMVYAARTAGLKFILNVVLNEDKEIIGSFAGDMERAHEKGCAFVADLAHVQKVQADITISTNGGYPLDQNIYQAGYVAGHASLDAMTLLHGKFQELDHGFDFYAPQIFQHEGRNLMLGWMGMPDKDSDYPTAEQGWMYSLTMPRELTLRQGHIYSKPAREMKALRIEETAMSLDSDSTDELMCGL